MRVVLLALMLSGCAAMKKAAIEDAMVAIWNDGDLERLDAAYDPSIVNGIREFVVEHRAVYPDIAITIDDFVVKGDRIVTVWTARGTHKDLGIPVELEGVSVRRIAGRRIVEERMFYDMKSVYDQLGFKVVPPDAATPFGPVEPATPEPDAAGE